MKGSQMKRLLIGGAVAAALVAVAVLYSSSVSAVGKNCPISGKPVKEGVSFNVNGKEVGFCCNGCPKAYLKKYQVVNGDGKCPLSGKDGKEETLLIHLTSKKVAFCCNNCPKGYAKKNDFALKDKGPAKCPVSGKDAKAEHKLVVNGESVYFCCNGCPKGYAKALNISKESNTKVCPVSGKPTKEGTEIIVTTGKKVTFCCNNCPKKYIATKINAPEEKPKKEKKKGTDV